MFNIIPIDVILTKSDELPYDKNGRVTPIILLKLQQFSRLHLLLL